MKPEQEYKQNNEQQQINEKEYKPQKETEQKSGNDTSPQSKGKRSRTKKVTGKKTEKSQPDIAYFLKVAGDKSVNIPKTRRGERTTGTLLPTQRAGNKKAKQMTNGSQQHNY